MMIVIHNPWKPILNMDTDTGYGASEDEARIFHLNEFHRSQIRKDPKVQNFGGS